MLSIFLFVFAFILYVWLLAFTVPMLIVFSPIIAALTYSDTSSYPTLLLCLGSTSSIILYALGIKWKLYLKRKSVKDK